MKIMLWLFPTLNDTITSSCILKCKVNITKSMRHTVTDKFYSKLYSSKINNYVRKLYLSLYYPFANSNMSRL